MKPDDSTQEVVTRTDLIDTLAVQARMFKPRLFTIYGLGREPANETLVGWGLQWQDPEHTFFYIPETRETFYADTADDVRRTLAIGADVRLVWMYAGEPRQEDG